MANIVLVGAQWGDEGKGKIIDFLAETSDYIVRFQGGSNAGHTVVIGDEQFILHLIPSGILTQSAVCIIGNGVVLDPKAFLHEVDHLTGRGIKVEGRLFVSLMCHIVMPYHRTLDKLSEEDLGSGKIGTTGRGIGPVYVDKAARRGIRLVDLLDPAQFRAKLEANVASVNEQLTKLYGLEPCDAGAIFDEYAVYAERLQSFAASTHLILHEAFTTNKDVLFEGAQGTLLDVDFGTYPYVTSSNASAGGALTGSGMGPASIDKVIGVMKAYTTRVGEGPFPSELEPALSEKMREEGREFGATTGRARRCGWFDGVIGRYSVIVNGITALAVTKLDVLDSFPDLKICTAYRYNGKLLTDFPSNMRVLAECEPVYEEYPGWMTQTSRAKRFEDLPDNARRYLDRLSALVGSTIEIVSVGSKRSQTFYR